MCKIEGSNSEQALDFRRVKQKQLEIDTQEELETQGAACEHYTQATATESKNNRRATESKRRGGRKVTPIKAFIHCCCQTTKCLN